MRSKSIPEAPSNWRLEPIGWLAVTWYAARGAKLLLECARRRTFPPGLVTRRISASAWGVLYLRKMKSCPMHISRLWRWCFKLVLNLSRVSVDTEAERVYHSVKRLVLKREVHDICLMSAFQVAHGELFSTVNMM